MWRWLICGAAQAQHQRVPTSVTLGEPDDAPVTVGGPEELDAATVAEQQQEQERRHREEVQELEEKVRQVTTAFARHLKNSSEILRIYNQAYEDLFVRGGDARPFIEFLKDSSTLFWDIAASISAMNHGVAVWRQHTAKSRDGKLAADDLTKLLGLLDRVIV